MEGPSLISFDWTMGKICNDVERFSAQLLFFISGAQSVPAKNGRCNRRRKCKAPVTANRKQFKKKRVIGPYAVLNAFTQELQLWETYLLK